MLYVSTRGQAAPVSSRQAVLQGLAPDGGLYMPEKMPVLDWKKTLELPVFKMAEAILSCFLPDIADMAGLVSRAYTGKFETEDLTPLASVGERYVLELFRGPTAAFKDVALSALPQLMVAAQRQEGMTDEIMILAATSGDTGKAAMAGFMNVPGTRITVFYPRDGVSAVQKAQMVTQEGENVRVCAVKGNFDDAQTGVKNIFSQMGEKLQGTGTVLSSANSINIGRLAPQVVYYFKAYADLVNKKKIAAGDPVDFTVPTGNFGNILAGYLAKLLGLPVGKLFCASNANNVLTDFLTTGEYDRNRPFYRTTSPSMDILVSSNLERLLYLASGCDADFVREKMQQLQQSGVYRIPEGMLQQIRETFAADCCDDAAAEETIGRVWREHGYLMDTHTAVAWAASEKVGRKDVPNVVLSTASAYKFPAAVVRGLGQIPVEDEFAVMQQLHEITGVPVPGNLLGLDKKSVQHKDVAAPEDMMAYVLGLVQRG